jgi:hypothetical protein
MSGWLWTLKNKKEYSTVDFKFLRLSGFAEYNILTREMNFIKHFDNKPVKNIFI